MSKEHIPVLLEESLQILDLKDGEIYLDATVGGGGHAAEISRRFRGRVEVVGIDADREAIETAKLRFEVEGLIGKFDVLNFRNIDSALQILGINRPDKILFDLGW